MMDSNVKVFNNVSLPDVIECKSSDEANRVNKDIYRFEKYSETRDVYIYIKRRGK